MRRKLQVLHSVIQPENKVICDIGCGVGGFSFALLESKPKFIVGIDLRKENLKKAKTLSQGYSNIDFIVSCAEALPVKEKVCDLALMIEVLEHVNNEDESIVQATKILKENGTVFLTAPNKLYPFETHGMKISQTFIRNILGVGIPFLSWLPQKFREKVETSRIFTEKQLVDLLEKHGFIILKKDYMMPPLDLIRRERLKTVLRKVFGQIESIPLLNRFGIHILLVARYTRQGHRGRC